ncbi:hypothetical protein F0919_14340 [Taibaiella lutea]|uniref:Lipid-binding serum glycoprotein N-terminal domain-containing protein n=1 Tax=Taibaiella lutea TaxID=2608001 RepID=A0A5M6CET5_9BACT|nr:hypothetical protein [Taibaiella lutea]KAA5533708.1 hypothetical protein F0919_14340 [Taibaiella lutea]
MGQFQDLLNAVISANLSNINSAATSAILSRGLDPMQNVTSGSQTIGSINLGICTAEAVASYVLEHLTGLSSFHINSLVVTSANASPDGSSVNGAIQLDAVLSSNIGIQVGGNFKAGCLYFTPSVGLSGNVSVSGVSISATGDFNATLGTQLCLTSMDVMNPNLNYNNVNINIDGLGILNELLGPLEDFILGLVKGQIISLIESSITPPINSAISGALPLCTSLS